MPRTWASGWSRLPLVDIEQRLELDDQLPVVVGHVLAVELLKCVDTLTRDETVKGVGFLEVAAVRRLVVHLDLDGYRGLALLADGDLLVIALDRRSAHC